MKIARNHDTTREAAKAIVERLIPSLAQQFGGSVSNLRYGWRGDSLDFSFQALGFKVKGALRVDDVEMTLDAKLPFLARPLEPKIRSELDRWFDENWPAVAIGKQGGSEARTPTEK